MGQLSPLLTDDVMRTLNAEVQVDGLIPHRQRDVVG